ncbi:MAG: glucose-6-phosphate dehydrogenase [Actinomycetota bacterium]
MSLDRPDPLTIVIFGASGDLTRRKAMPALYNLYRENLLPDAFAIVGFARTHMSDDEFRHEMKLAVMKHSRSGIADRHWYSFVQHLNYFSGGYSDAGAWADFRKYLDSIDERFDTEGRRLFYCATPPSAFPVIATRIGEAGLNDNARIVVEKPFGHDLESAKELNSVLHDVFGEMQIFRIDHYLGKETVQNILVFRFANGMFEPIWNRSYVECVQIDVAESVGIEGRGSFYEEAGAIRDIVQNHMMQLVATLGLEPPAAFEAESIRNEKVKLLKSVRPIERVNVVKGQYTAGVVGGHAVAGYQQEEDVANGSMTETYAAMKLEVDNWRWAGVPWQLRSGKRMPKRATTITVIFHKAPHMLFDASGIEAPEQNHLTIRVQPDEGITLTFGAKVPGPDMKVAPVDMHFDYDESFMGAPAEAYERLLLDAMLGDATLFTRADEIERSWEIVSSILPKWVPEPYPAGTWGPSAADDLVSPRGWH